MPPFDNTCMNHNNSISSEKSGHPHQRIRVHPILYYKSLIIPSSHKVATTGFSVQLRTFSLTVTKLIIKYHIHIIFLKCSFYLLFLAESMLDIKLQITGREVNFSDI